MALDLSVVIPLFNEEPNVGEVYRELSKTLTDWHGTYEIILVDDGSTDGTFEQLKRIQAADASVRVIRLRRNFGQTAAFIPLRVQRPAALLLGGWRDGWRTIKSVLKSSRCDPSLEKSRRKKFNSVEIFEQLVYFPWSGLESG